MIKSTLTSFLLLVLVFAQAQKIPFQGKLVENNVAVTGTKTFQFSIDSTWSETHTDVNVQDGFYAVVLGSINPLPVDLYQGRDEVSLSINVDGTALSSVQLFAPISSAEVSRREYIGPDDLRGSDTVYYFQVNADVNRVLQVDNLGSGSRGNAYGIRANSISQAGDTTFRVGVFGSATGDGSGDHTGLYGQGWGQGHFNNGVVGRAGGAGNGDVGFGTGSYNSGIYGAGFNNAWGNVGVTGEALGSTGVDNVGVSGVSRVNDGSDTIQNKGMIARAEGPGINYGIMAEAFGGKENYAGIFNGDVDVNGVLRVNGQQVGASDSISARDIEVTDEFGTMKAHLNYFGPNKSGSLVINGANDSTKVILGTGGGGYGAYLGMYDSLRYLGARLGVNNKGRGNLFTYNEQHKNVGWIGSNDGNSGLMQIVGYDDAGNQLGAMLGYHPGGLPTLILESNNGGVGPFANLIHLNTFQNGVGNYVGEINLGSQNRTNNGVGSGITMSIDDNDLPFIQLKGGNDLGWDVRGQFKLDSVGSLGTAGRLELLGPGGNVNNDVLQLFSVGASFDPGGQDAGRAAGEMFLWGGEAPNFQFGGRQWENTDQAYFTMYGSHDDGGGWYMSNLNMEVVNQGAYEGVSFKMFNTQSGGIAQENVLIESNLYGSNGGGIVLRNLSDSVTIELLGEGGTINATTVNQSSDRRLKENIVSQEGALAKVKELQGVTYEWKNDETDAQNIGFIAQEVEKVYPEVVTTRQDGFKAVNYAVLVSALVEAIKELDAKVADLKTENADLKAALNESASQDDLSELKAEIESIKKLLSLSVEQNKTTTVGQTK
ncbi:tail fiber domain-containing protein [Marinoscillum furvescens]|uniref:Endosialidase-like protein n=1 Tax=Marinoscillum furvescens DSM 4134 TaxID=1122208 RepID=A0A3D9L1D9_MARFU|nr:tail fiber domain-containing protein [Marinoscillum furvescens]RED97409.1 endosialidase-like protein [Marinoscillum furvescens DSM 4134]